VSWVIRWISLRRIFLQCLVIGRDRLLQLPRPALPLPERCKRNGEIVLRHRPVERNAMRRRRSASIHLQRSPGSPARDRQPFVLITGAVYPGSLSWSTPAGRRAALNKWCAVIVREVGKRYQTKTERDEAEAFARSHRLSIANAFERKLVRKDVVEELTRLFEARMTDP
jgi:hypothetical protein